jgi:multiple sugar transport system substrate-binding protein
MKKRLERIEKALPGEAFVKSPINRRQFVAGASMTSFSLLLAACGGDDDEEATPTGETGATTGTAPSGEEAPLKDGLAEGMYGGPVGFPGAERYQYEFDSEEGRAISALKKLRQDGQAPEKLVVQVLNFARPQFENAFPEGAPTYLELFQEETGITIEFVETDPATEYPDNLRNASTRNGSFDLVTTAIEEIGDFAEAGLLLPLGEYVEKYQPSWNDPVYGFAGGEPTVNLFSKYKDEYYVVAFDNDTQPYFYRGDLLDDPKEQAAFEDKYGRALRFPITWDEQAEVAEFFTRSDQQLYGDVSTAAPFWGVVNWNERFVCSADPNMVYFNDDMSANVNNEAGVRAFAELKKALEWHGPGALEKDWLAQYQLMGAGNGWGGPSFPNQTKLVPGNPDLDTANVGQYIRTDVMPGRVVDGALIRRPVIFYNICYGVNAFADPSHHEAAYLFLQWAGGARAYTFLTFNPAGYQDPHHLYTLEDPYTAQSYKPQPLGEFANIVPRSAPPINLKGGGAYRDSLSEILQAVYTNQQSPEQAAKSLEDRWNKITEEQGTELQVAALPTLLASFPTVTDTPDEELEHAEVSTVVG